jgi:hypothetical protein
MIKWKEPTFDDTPLLKALAAANALRKAEEYDYEEEQKERGIAYPDWAKEWIKKYKEAWYIAEASGDQVSKDQAKGLAEGLREKLADIAKMPDWAQQQMGKQTQIWMEANEVGNVKAMKVADEASVGIRDKLATIEKIKGQSQEDAKTLNDLTAKWYSADDYEFVPYEDKDNYKGPEEAKKDYSDKAQAIMKKYEPKPEEKPKQTVISSGAQGTGKDGLYISNKALTMEQMKVNAQYIYDYLLAKGWTEHAISAVLGNMQTESTINPGRWEGGQKDNMNVGFGLVQWTKARKYFDWADKNGLDPYDMDSQLKRILYEVDTKNPNDIQWIPKGTKMTFKQFTQSTDSLEELAKVFINSYERPYDSNQPKRGEQAEYWYKVLN